MSSLSSITSWFQVQELGEQEVSAKDYAVPRGKGIRNWDCG